MVAKPSATLVLCLLGLLASHGKSLNGWQCIVHTSKPCKSSFKCLLDVCITHALPAMRRKFPPLEIFSGSLCKTAPDLYT